MGNFLGSSRITDAKVIMFLLEIISSEFFFKMIHINLKSITIVLGFSILSATTVGRMFLDTEISAHFSHRVPLAKENLYLSQLNDELLWDKPILLHPYLSTFNFDPNSNILCFNQFSEYKLANIAKDSLEDI